LNVDGNRDVVYVATEGNTVYAIDAATGAVLLHRNLGTPVKISLLGNCTDNGGQIGITSTPVIDRAANRLYLIAYTNDAGVLTYRLHALNLTSLADAIPPVVVAASHILNDGTTSYTFQASRNRQRPALLEANGNIYAGFGSFCDFFSDLSRGWVLGWNARTLQSLTANRLNDLLVNSFYGYFLSSVWMSGAGLAASADGSIFFVSGNSDPTGTSYDPVSNLAESVVKISGDLTQILDYFTPNDVSFLDQNNADFSAGGVLLIPTQSGPIPNLAVHLGKIGPLYLLNQQNLGNFTPTASGGTQCSPRAVCPADNVVGNYALDPTDDCWCTPSYFTGSDGVGRVVLSAGHHVIIWQIQTSSTVTLVKERTLADISSAQDAGFFTSVSSNGTTAGTAVVWAVSRPTDTSPANVLLYAFDPTNGSLLFSANAGTWPSPGNANIVPVVANGQVFVGSYKRLAIFGPTTAGAAVASAGPALTATTSSQTPVHGNQVTGRVLRISGSEVIVQQYSGVPVKIDAKPAQNARQSVLILKGEIITVEGELDALGVLHAKTIVRAKPSPALWPRDQ
jgi:outer membrane protein assembly factor BamB